MLPNPRPLSPASCGFSVCWGGGLYIYHDIHMETGRGNVPKSRACVGIQGALAQHAAKPWENLKNG